MNAAESYALFQSLRRHFNSSYDFFKYNGKIRMPKTLGKEIFQYEKLAKHKDPQGLIVANLLYKDIPWIGAVFDEHRQKTYIDWLKRKQSLTYTISEDIQKISKNSFRINHTGYPELFILLRQGDISPETFCILAHVSNAYSSWNAKINDPIIWEDASFRLMKYYPFITWDREKIFNILKNHLTETTI